MSSRWRTITLTQVYPYWIIGEVPDSDIPYIACNDMLAGNMADEIVAVAALTQHDLAEAGDLLPRAFARLGLPPMTEREAAKLLAPERMGGIARQIVHRQQDPLRGANSIYWRAVEGGLLHDDDDVAPRVAEYGVEFLQLADALEARQGDPARKRQFEELIIEAAEALLAGQPTPEWYSDGKDGMHRGTRSSTTPREPVQEKDDP